VKKIATYFEEPGFDAYPFDDVQYCEGYYKLAEIVAEKGGQFFIVRGQDTYRGGNVFRGGWVYGDDRFERTDKEIQSDVIFNKGRLIADDDAVMINEKKLEAICTDKSQTYAVFRDFSPATIIAHSERELEDAFAKIPGDLVVAKPLDRQGGEGVFIGTRPEVVSKIEHFPYLVQEFIDTRNGIPGIAKGMHELRLIILKGEIIAAFARAPRRGSFLANESQGGRIWNIPLGDIPRGATELFAQVDRKLASFPKRLYCLDCGLNHEGSWKIVELNSQPGLSINDYRSPDGRAMWEKIADLLLA
jgi:glutathione synthase/RimK-type ligase-like ATP-grasp enzyme